MSKIRNSPIPKIAVYYTPQRGILAVIAPFTILALLLFFTPLGAGAQRERAPIYAAPGAAGGSAINATCFSDVTTPGWAVNFTGVMQSNGTVEYSWYFGDNTSATGWVQGSSANYTYIYDTPGNYTATLYAKDSLGNNRNASIYNITVRNTAPVATFRPTHRSTRAGEPITFDAATSVDVDGSVRLYVWDLNGDGVYDRNSADSRLTYEYMKPGDYEVALSVMDNNGTWSKPSAEFVSVLPAEDKWSLDDPNVIGLILSAIGLIVGYAAYNMKKMVLGKHLKTVSDTYAMLRNKPEKCEDELNALRNKFLDQFEAGKLDGNNYLILEKKIENYVKELRTRSVESQIGANSIPSQLQETIKEILADGRVDKKEYAELTNAVAAAKMSDGQRKQLQEMFYAWTKADEKFKRDAPPEPQEQMPPALPQPAQKIPDAMASAHAETAPVKQDSAAPVQSSANIAPAAGAHDKSAQESAAERNNEGTAKADIAAERGEETERETRPAPADGPVGEQTAKTDTQTPETRRAAAPLPPTQIRPLPQKTAAAPAGQAARPRGAVPKAKCSRCGALMNVSRYSEVVKSAGGRRVSVTCPKCGMKGTLK